MPVRIANTPNKRASIMRNNNKTTRGDETRREETGRDKTRRDETRQRQQQAKTLGKCAKLVLNGVHVISETDKKALRAL